MVPTSGFFCSLCSIFYQKENMAKERHCSSRRHYESLQVRSHVHKEGVDTLGLKSLTPWHPLCVDRNITRSINGGLHSLQLRPRTDPERQSETSHWKVEEKSPVKYVCFLFWFFFKQVCKFFEKCLSCCNYSNTLK